MIIVCDVRGTLLNHHGYVNQKVNDYVMDLIQNSRNRLIIWSGNGTEVSATVAKTAGLDFESTKYFDKSHFLELVQEIGDDDVMFIDDDLDLRISLQRLFPESTVIDPSDIIL